MRVLPIRTLSAFGLSLLSTAAFAADATLCIGNCGDLGVGSGGGSVSVIVPNYSEVTVQELTIPRSFQWNGFMSSAQLKSTPGSGYDLASLSNRLGLVSGQSLPVSFSLNLTQLTTTAAVTNLNNGIETRVSAHRYALASYTLSFGDIVLSEAPALDAELPAHPFIDTSTLRSGFHTTTLPLNNWSPFGRDAATGDFTAVRVSSARLNISGEAAQGFVTTLPAFGTSLNDRLSSAQTGVGFLQLAQSTSLVFNLGGDVSAYPDLYPATDGDLSTLFDGGAITLGLNPLTPNIVLGVAAYIELQAVLSSTETPLSIDPSLVVLPGNNIVWPGDVSVVTVPLPPGAILLLSALSVLARRRSRWV